MFETFNTLWSIKSSDKSRFLVINNIVTSGFSLSIWKKNLFLLLGIAVTSLLQVIFYWEKVGKTYDINMDFIV